MLGPEYSTQHDEHCWIVISMFDGVSAFKKGWAKIVEKQGDLVKLEVDEGYFGSVRIFRAIWGTIVYNGED